MSSDYDTTEFIDGDFQAQKSSYGVGSALRAPSRDEVDAKVVEAQQKLADLKRTQEQLERQRAANEARISALTEQNNFLKENNNQALKQLQHLSVISSQQAESIKKSMDNIGMKDSYIQNLQQQMARKDSLNMALVMNLKGAIGNMADEDINIKV